jgi:hypothetical protein
MATFSYRRELPVIEDVDVLVVGGGMAGASAAIAAARQGVRTLLVERHAILGGAATTGGVGSFCGETTGQGEVFDDIVCRLAQMDAIAAYRPYYEVEARAFDHQIMPIVLQELALEADVEILLHAWGVDVDYTDGLIKHVVILGKSGLQVIQPRFVIDCTGEADIVHAAGLPTFKGRDGDQAQLPMALMFFMSDTGTKVHSRLPQGCIWLNKDDLPMTGVFPERDGPVADAFGRCQAVQDPPPAPEERPVLPKLAVKIKVVGYDSTDTRDLSAAELSARRLAFSIAHYLQRSGYRTYQVDHVASQIGIREGRRAHGEYVLTEQDVREGRHFDDGIALGVFYLDAMDPDTDKKVYTHDRHGRIKFQPPPYQIPFRSLRPIGSRNLLVAGRCLSADQMALSSARVMTTASMMGQAAGIASALCVDGDSDSGDLDIQKLRSILIEKSAIIEA